MDLNRVRTFLTVVEAGSVTHAARKLYRTQQAISLQLKQLERELQLNLVNHKGSRLVLTAAGQSLYRKLKPQFAEILRTVDEIRTDRTQTTGTLRIGAWLAQTVAYLPHIIASYTTRFPGVNIEIRTGTDDDIIRWIEDNTVDLGFVLRVPANRLLSDHLVYEQPLLPVASTEFFRVHPRPRHATQTLSLPLIDFPSGISAYESWIRNNARNLLPLARKKIPVATVDNVLTARELIFRGIGFGFLHYEVVRAELQTRGLERISLRDCRKSTVARVRLVFKKKNSLAFVHQQFAQTVLDHRDRWRFVDHSSGDA